MPGRPVLFALEVNTLGALLHLVQAKIAIAEPFILTAKEVNK